MVHLLVWWFLYHLFVSIYMCAFVNSHDIFINDEQLADFDYIYQVEANKFPWLAAFKTTFNSSNANIPGKCGGVIVSISWVLSAAHCLDRNVDPSVYIVFTGGNYDFQESENQELATKLGYQFQKVRALYINPEYHLEPKKIGYSTKNALYFQYNVALLNLEMPFTPQPNKIRLNIISLVKAPIEQHPTPRLRECLILGWGIWNPDSNISHSHSENDGPDTLVYRKVTAVTFLFCARNRNTSNVRSVCILDSQNRPCSGDPGTPLVCVTEGDRMRDELEVVGLSSCNDEGLMCGTTSRYLHIGVFRNWIDDTIVEDNLERRQYLSSAVENPYAKFGLVEDIDSKKEDSSERESARAMMTCYFVFIMLHYTFVVLVLY